jgi:hypothetical protein
MKRNINSFITSNSSCFSTDTPRLAAGQFIELISDPSKLLRRTCKFIGIDAEFRFRNHYKTYNPTVGRQPKFIEGAAYKKLQGVIPWRIRNWIGKTVAQRVRKKAKLSSVERKDALEKLRPDLIALEEYGVDIDSWSIEVKV